MSKIKKPSISDQKKINEVMELMNKYDIKITRTVDSDSADLVLYINGKYYTIIKSDYFPTISDDDSIDFVKSDPYGQIYEYDNKGNVIN